MRKLIALAILAGTVGAVAFDVAKAVKPAATLCADGGAPVPNYPPPPKK